MEGRRASLIASSVQYALNVAATLPALFLIEKIGRRPLMLYGAIMMGVWLALVGGLQAGLGHQLEGAAAEATTTWIVTGHKSGSYAIIGELPQVEQCRIGAVLTQLVPDSLLLLLRVLVRRQLGCT